MIVINETSVSLMLNGPDGAAVASALARLLPLKTRAEYDPEDVPDAAATRAVEQAQRCVVAARRAAQSL
jgi:hypothetical protein